MGRYRMTRRIRATREEVFRAFTDEAIVADWMEASGIVDQRGPLDQVGSTYTLVIWGPWRFRTRVTRSDPPEAYVLTGDGPLGAWYRLTGTLTEIDEGTELVLDTEYTVPLGPIGRWIDRRWIKPGPDSAANREFDRLVQIVSGADDEPVVPGGRRARQRNVAASMARPRSS